MREFKNCFDELLSRSRIMLRRLLDRYFREIEEKFKYNENDSTNY